MIIVIEDEEYQVEIIMEEIRKALHEESRVSDLSKGIGLRSYKDMAEFVTSEDGMNRELRAIIVVDLFLFRGAEDPATVFRQLMCTLFPWQPDGTLVAGRLGMLGKLYGLYPKSLPAAGRRNNK